MRIETFRPVNPGASAGVYVGARTGFTCECGCKQGCQHTWACVQPTHRVPELPRDEPAEDDAITPNLSREVQHTDESVVPKSVTTTRDAAPNCLLVHLQKPSKTRDETQLLGIVGDDGSEQSLEREMVVTRARAASPQCTCEKKRVLW